MIIHNGNTIPILNQSQDPNAAREYAFVLRPEIWQPDTVYYDNESIVIPSVFNGFYYIAISGGKSLAVEPAFPCQKSKTVDDGCVLWKAVPYDIFLRPGKNIATAAWSADNAGVTISIPTTTADRTTAVVSTIPSDVTQVKITIHFTYNTPELDDFSFIIPVAEL